MKKKGLKEMLPHCKRNIVAAFLRDSNGLGFTRCITRLVTDRALPSPLPLHNK